MQGGSRRHSTCREVGKYDDLLTTQTDEVHRHHEKQHKRQKRAREVLGRGGNYQHERVLDKRRELRQRPRLPNPAARREGTEEEKHRLHDEQHQRREKVHEMRDKSGSSTGRRPARTRATARAETTRRTRSA